jgi:pyruvate dehydrogenase E2 component (dihydrolipoamide acetyltransferase)
MAEAIRMPKLGQEMTQGRVVEWSKQVGDEVVVGELIAMVETDKTTVDLESPVGGFVGEFMVELDETVDVGTVIVWVLERPDEVVPSAAREPEAEPFEAAPDTTRSARISASPLARRRAEQLGIDLATVAPTGPQGWVTVEDLEAVVAASTPVTSSALTPMRKAIAAQMTRSASIPQFRVSREVDVTDIVASLDGERATITDAVLWATANALALHPEINASWVDGSPPTIVRHAQVVVGVAIAVDAGLIVPVIAGADSLSLTELHDRRVELETAARRGTLSSSQLQGATFTVSNLGSLGVDQFEALVNPPEAGILAVGTARRRAVVVDDSIGVRTTMMLTFTGDHRVVDGAGGARFLAAIASLLSGPRQDQVR